MASSRQILRVIVADDELQICTLLRETLTQMGHFVEICRDGEAALAKFQDGTGYGLLVLDVVMPHKTGVEVIRELRKRGSDVPIVLMSSFLSDEVLSSLTNLERLEFLQKPFSLVDFRAAVERVTRPVRC